MRRPGVEEKAYLRLRKRASASKRKPVDPEELRKVLRALPPAAAESA
jgi:hypothetical protein